MGDWKYPANCKRRGSLFKYRKYPSQVSIGDVTVHIHLFKTVASRIHRGLEQHYQLLVTGFHHSALPFSLPPRTKA